MSKANKNSDPASTEKKEKIQKTQSKLRDATADITNAINNPEENDQDAKVLEELQKESCYKLKDGIKSVKKVHALLGKRNDIIDALVRKKVNGIAKDLLNTYGINTYDDSKEPVSVTLVEALHKIQGNDQEYDPVELRNKVPSLRFADMADESLSEVHEEEKAKLEKLSADILKKYGIQVRLIEKIDVKDTSLKKFYIRLTDKNGNYIELDLLDYQKKIYDFTEDEEETLKNKIVDLKGVYDGNTMKAASDIAKYISLALKYKEYFWYQYDRLGWDDIYIDNVCHKIFKYNTIYSRNDLKIQGFCDRDWSSYLEPHGPSSEKVPNTEENEWFNKYVWYIGMHMIFKDRPIPDILLSVGASGVIRDLLTPNKETNLNVNIVAPAASGKSTLENVILSFYGRPDYLMGTFSDTDSAVDEIRGIRNVIPYVVDDRMLKVQTNGDTKKAYTLLMDIFREYNGKEKSRIGASNSTSLSASGAVISSTTQSILKVINEQYEGYDYGQSRRFIEFELQPEDMFESAVVAETSNNLAHVCYGYGVQQMIETILLLDNCIEVYTVIDHLEKEKKISSTERLKKIIKEWYSSITSEKCKATYDYNINNLEKLFNIIKVLVAGNIEKVTKPKANDTDEEINDKNNLKIELTSLSQRFAMILLSGLIIDISMDMLKNNLVYEAKYSKELEKYESFNINLQDMLDELIKNQKRLYNNRKFISKQAEKENARRQQIEAIEKKKKDNKLAEEEAKLAEDEARKASEIANKTVKSLEYKRQTVDLYDWIKSNLQYFYIIKATPEEAENNKKKDKKSMLGSYQRDGGCSVVKFVSEKQKDVFGLMLHGERDIEFLTKYVMASEDEVAAINEKYTKSLNYDDYNLVDIQQSVNFSQSFKAGRSTQVTFDPEIIDQYRKELNEGDDDHASN